MSAWARFDFRIGEWEEDKHPRDDRGRFAPSGGESSPAIEKLDKVIKSEEAEAAEASPAKEEIGAGYMEHHSISYFGTTDDPKEAGYIMQGGEMLDFSGKREGGSPGMRSYDHRQVGMAFEDTSFQGGTEGMAEFMDKTGAVRLNYFGGKDISIDAAQPLTGRQVSAIIAIPADTIIWDASAPDGTVVGHGEGEKYEIDDIAQKIERAIRQGTRDRWTREHGGKVAAIGARTLYAHRKLLNHEELRAWAREVGIGELDDDLHVTIAYSTTPLDWPKTRAAQIEVQQADRREIEQLGDEGAVVLRFESEVLHRDWQRLCDAGAAWSHPSYKPHVTLTYDDVGTGFAPYRGSLIFGPEIYEEIGDDGMGVKVSRFDFRIGEWDESQHPRDDAGKFTESGEVAVASPGRVMFHISPRRNRESIARDGVKLSESPSKFAWLFDNEEDARRHLNAIWGGDKHADLYAIDVGGLELRGDPHPGFQGEMTWVSEKAIPATRVKQIDSTPPPLGGMRKRNAAEWDEGKHPREPAGSSAGGQFSGGGLSEVVAQLRGGGFTFHPSTGTVPTKGYVVSLPRELGTEHVESDAVLNDEAATTKMLEDYIVEHWSKLSESDAVHLGGWRNEGKVYLDLNEVVADRTEAARLGKERKQEGIYDLQAGEVIEARDYDAILEGRPRAATARLHEVPRRAARGDPRVRPRVRSAAQKVLGPSGGRPSLVDDEFYTLVHRNADDAIPEMRQAFIRDVRSMAVYVDREAFERAVRAGEVHRAVEMLLPPPSFLRDNPLARVFNKTAEQSTEEVVSQLRAARLRVGQDEVIDKEFDYSNPEAILHANEFGADLVRDITDEMRTTIREKVANAIATGIDPKKLARQLIDQGLGLDARRMDAVASYYDRLIDEEGYDEPEAEAIAGRYYEGQLRDRALTIARTETMLASDAGQLEAWRQVSDAGLIDPGTQRGWLTTPDELLCPVCAAMDGQLVSIDEPWTLPDGTEAMTPAEAHPNCRCAQYLATGVLAGEVQDVGELQAAGLRIALPNDQARDEIEWRVAFREDQARDEQGRWTDEGWGAGSSWTDLKGEGLDQKALDTIDKAVETYKINTDAMRGAIEKRLTPELLQQGAVWYADAHQEAEDLGTHFHVPLDRSIGVIAVLSTGTSWEYNTFIAEQVMEFHSTYKGDPAQEVKAFAASFLAQSGARPVTYPDNIKKAIAILQGGDLNSIVVGAKVQAFATEIANKGQGISVTADRHMGKLFREGDNHLTLDASANLLAHTIVRDKKIISGAGQAIIARACRDVAAKISTPGHRVSASTIQAAYWIKVRNLDI